LPGGNGASANGVDPVGRSHGRPRLGHRGRACDAATGRLPATGSHRLHRRSQSPVNAIRWGLLDPEVLLAKNHTVDPPCGAPIPFGKSGDGYCRSPSSIRWGAFCRSRTRKNYDALKSPCPTPEQGFARPRGHPQFPTTPTTHPTMKERPCYYGHPTPSPTSVSFGGNPERYRHKHSGPRSEIERRNSRRRAQKKIKFSTCKSTGEPLVQIQIVVFATKPFHSGALPRSGVTMDMDDFAMLLAKGITPHFF